VCCHHRQSSSASRFAAGATEFGLLRQVAVDASKTYFDTNNSAHHHFFIEDKNELMDIPMSTTMLLGETPIPPEGYEIARIDVVVRVR